MSTRSKSLLFFGLAFLVVILYMAASGGLDSVIKWIKGDHPDPGLSAWGKFSGQPKAEWLDNGRNMKLIADFSYTDPSGKVWLAKSGSKVDGASIPWPFWSVTGGPFEGKFRNASIVHDVACVERKEPSEDVHNMFYQACRCGGVDEIQAKILYSAVAFGGPSWELKKVFETRTRVLADGQKTTESVGRDIVVEKSPRLKSDDDRMRKLTKWIQEKNPTLEEIQKYKPE